jgi:uncharacterized protein (DUF2164 family)
MSEIYYRQTLRKWLAQLRERHEKLAAALQNAEKRWASAQDKETAIKLVAMNAKLIKMISAELGEIREP